MQSYEKKQENQSSLLKKCQINDKKRRLWPKNLLFRKNMSKFAHIKEGANAQ